MREYEMNVYDHSMRHERVLAYAEEEVRLHADVHVAEWHPTGSAFYGVREPGDFDVLMLVRGKGLLKSVDFADVMDRLEEYGWMNCAGKGYPVSGNRLIIRHPAEKGSINIMLFSDYAEYHRHVAASYYVKHSGKFTTKEEVGVLFETIRGED